MLKEIYIENLAVIEKAIIPFSGEFNVFTGETGAGKSILINGINAVLGQRVTRDIVRTGTKKAVVTALFTGLDKSVKQKLEEYGISYDNDEITVTREIFADGGSTARINSRVTTVTVLKDISTLLITIHGQHDNQILLSPENHLNVIDQFGETVELLEDYKQSFRSLQNLAKQIGNMKKAGAQRRNRIIFLQERIAELESLELREGENEQLENDYQLIQNTDKIARSIQLVREILNGENDTNIIDMMSECENEISGISDYSSELADISERISAAVIEISDISEELARAGEKLEIDPEKFEIITARYNKINHAKKIYNCDYAGLLEMYNEAVKELSEIEFSDEDIKRLIIEKDNLLHEVTEKAKKLSGMRKEASAKFISQVTEELRFLDMPNVILDIKHDVGKLTINGMDSIEFLISANRGEDPKPIAKIASGGELSRIMLALKSVIAEKDSIPTMIFDEIDTGVSGRAAHKIGVKMKQISRIRQVLCVTHLSQLAVMADNHLLIEKNTVNERTYTAVTQLDFNGRINEIARIMGGENPSGLMLKNAEEELKKFSANGSEN